MQILLINTNRKADMLAAPPLGLAYVAAAAAAAGHEVRVLDLCFVQQAQVQAQLENVVKSFNPRVVGLSVRNLDNCNLLYPVSYLPEVRAIAAYLRRLTAAPVVVGGSGAGLCPEAVLKYLGADYVVVSEGEEAFIHLLHALEHGDIPAGIPGLGMMGNQGFRFTPSRPQEFPEINPDLGRWVNLRPYFRLGSAYPVQSKRGCLQQCIYCTYGQLLEGRRRRLRPPVEVVDEVEEIVYKYRPPLLEFVDAVFNDAWEHTAAILEEIIHRPWKARFTAMGLRPVHLDKPFLGLMWRAGFRTFMVTPESASDVMLANYGKGFTREDVLRTAAALEGTRFTVWWYFLIGGPGETDATFQESLDFARNLAARKRRGGRHLAHFFLGVRLYPGTALWELARQQDLLADGADPLTSRWYLSRHLDLEKTVAALMAAARETPGLYAGLDEAVLESSRLYAFLFRLFHLPGPYWRFFRGGSGSKRFPVTPGEIAARIREAVTTTMKPPMNADKHR
jgi:radical SAM superfamily enzyme YgiQ (UPF0313 family)